MTSYDMLDQEIHSNNYYKSNSTHLEDPFRIITLLTFQWRIVLFKRKLWFLFFIIEFYSNEWNSTNSVPLTSDAYSILSLMVLYLVSVCTTKHVL